MEWTDPGNFNHIIKESSIHFEFLVVGYGSNIYMTNTKTSTEVNSLLEKGNAL
ncbi:MAG TPA: hypothetical protein VFI70_07605 [Nitrososphaeraceae archaeon]|nr:hypothetical protein [Nitrososphaeraceae archaeon]